MVIPWVGFPLADLLKRFKPTSKAKYVEFTTLFDPKQMPGQRTRVLEWPYVEGLRMDEAMHPLALMAVGLYGKVLPNQNGAPLRLVVPWKYGFKGIKSIVKIKFTEHAPRTTWTGAAPDEYGFYANVNPDGRPSPLEPGHRAAHRRECLRPAAADAALQRLCRPGRGPVYRDGSAEILSDAAAAVG